MPILCAIANNGLDGCLRTQPMGDRMQIMAIAEINLRSEQGADTVYIRRHCRVGLHSFPQKQEI